jgi:hypothetical protein
LGGGRPASDSGIVLLAEVERRLRIAERARTWDTERRVIARVEASAQGVDSRLRTRASCRFARSADGRSEIRSSASSTSRRLIALFPRTA